MKSRFNAKTLRPNDESNILPRYRGKPFRCAACDWMAPIKGAMWVKVGRDGDMLICQPCVKKVKARQS